MYQSAQHYVFFAVFSDYLKAHMLVHLYKDYITYIEELDSIDDEEETI